MSVDSEAASQETRESIIAFIKCEAAKQEAMAVGFFDKFSDMKFGGAHAEAFKAQGQAYRFRSQLLLTIADKISKKADLLKVCAPPEG